MSIYLDVYAVAGRGPAGVRVVVVERHLADGPREGRGQLAAGVHVAEEGVDDRVAGLGPAEPGLEDRRHVVGDPGDGQRPAVHQHDHRRLAGRVDRLDEVELVARQADRAAGRRLAAHLRRLADDEDGDVGLAGDPRRPRRTLRSSRPRPRSPWRRRPSSSPGRPGDLRPERGQDRHDVGRPTVGEPVPQRRLPVVGERPDQGDRAGPIAGAAARAPRSSGGPGDRPATSRAAARFSAVRIDFRSRPSST